MENKYLKDIDLIDGKIDVYCVLKSFNVICPARQHAIKKLLCSGLRGAKSEGEDLKEASQAVNRAIELNGGDVSFVDMQDDILKRAIDFYGVENQEAVAVGEIGELLRLFGRRAQKRASQDEWVDEIADTIIMLSQLAIIHGQRDVLIRIDEKVKRLKKRIEKFSAF